MDLAKYIGLFLLKNRFCYIHGLGNLEVKKKPTNFDGKTLQASPYEVVITPAGSIDDTLANFIATNEQISISKAANALRDFSTQARADLHAGKDVVIPYIGKFTEENGKISFTTDPNFQFTPAGIPSIRTTPHNQGNPVIQAKPDPNVTTSNNPLPAPKLETYAAKESISGGGLNWTRIILAAVVILVIAGGIIFYFMVRGGNNQVVNIPTPVKETPPQPAPDTAGKKIDSAMTHQGMDTTPAGTPAVSADSIQSYRMIVGVYTDKAKAEKRVNQFTHQLGKKAEMVTKDSATYYVVMPVKAKPADTTHVEDSLRKFYYPSGKVSIYQ